jgi:hypothetical protein
MRQCAALNPFETADIHDQDIRTSLEEPRSVFQYVFKFAVNFPAVLWQNDEKNRHHN